jgi:2-oxoglutarate dehydrogenase E1 component
MSADHNSFLYSANADFIAELFQRFAADPASVDLSWQSFFSGLNDDARNALVELQGASWTPGKTAPRVIGTKDDSAPAAKGTAAPGPVSERAIVDSIRAIMLIRVHRVRGHLQAKLDPLGIVQPEPHPELDPHSYGFTDADFDRPIFLDGSLGLKYATLREIMTRLSVTYCGRVGTEFMHIQSPAEKQWIQERMENTLNTPAYDAAGKKRLLERLTAGDGFERFLATKFVGVKRFGLEGGEAMIPAIEAAIAKGAQLGLREDRKSVV